MFFFLNRKKAVRAAVVAKWPGNDLPNFKRDPTQLKVLGQLVEELEEDCTYITVGFDKQAIRQHILDILNERRRHVRNGHDYTKVLVWPCVSFISFCFVFFSVFFTKNASPNLDGMLSFVW